MRVLVAGWFSFEQMGATAGDLLARDVVCRWLDDAGREYDVAHAPPFPGGVDWRKAEPSRYSELVFVCGPFGNGPPLTELLERFAGVRLVGVDLTLLEPLRVWDPFDLLLERDSSRATRPDVSFLSDAPLVPVVGLCLIHPQPEYRERDAHERANAALRRLVAEREAAVVEIDTRLDENGTGLRTPAEVESLLARMDVVLTTRLHGMVLALKNGVPAVVIDPVAGGAKITRQAETVGWPYVFSAHVGHANLAAALTECLTEAAREQARNAAAAARAHLRNARAAFLAAMAA